ncbi:MAG: hypothetical protein IJW51_02240 [Clostridia bacterium]|nr:hypothetical protein [Clostridia bacterium]
MAQVTYAPQVARCDTAAPEERSVLFVCTGNTCRSPMAAALLNDLMRPREVCTACADRPAPRVRVRAFSAGLYAVAGAPISANALQVLRAAGVAPTPDNDYPAHRARTVTEEMMEAADEVVAITGSHAMELMLRFPEHAAKISTLPVDIPDPYGGDETVYRGCLNMLSYAIALRWGNGGEQP